MDARPYPTALFRTPLFAALALTSFLVACSGDEPSKTPPPGTPASATAKPSANMPGNPPAAGMPAMPTGHPKLDGSSILFTMPEGWVQETPSVAMRREQYKLSKQAGDADDAAVTVTVLAPGDGGGKEGNLQRWADQFAQPDGKPSIEVLQQSTRKVNGMDVIDVDISGTYVAAVSMSAPERFNKPGWRMLLSWVQSPLGNYYIKAVGPQATIAHWEPSFRKFVGSGKVQ
jgi:hypothetical protein